MVTNILLIAFGVAALVLIMALFLNPPEALVKRYLRGKRRRSGPRDQP